MKLSHLSSDVKRLPKLMPGRKSHSFGRYYINIHKPHIVPNY